jgi:ABC-type dipeptide/oligopeptide/nickel transport system ATPase subunit
MDIHYKNNEYTSLSELSGGEQSRISIALTMAFNEVANSKMIILDESLNSLDTEHQNKVINILNRSGVSTFVISHSVTTGLFEKVIKL